MTKQKLHPVTSTTLPAYDQCQTPNWATQHLLTHLTNFHRLTKQNTIIEPACGEGLMVESFKAAGFQNIAYSDIAHSDKRHRVDFFNIQTSDVDDSDWIITNPPFSIKWTFLEHCYRLETSFALLMPLSILGTVKAQKLFGKYGVDVLLLPKRVNYKMPNKGFEGTSHFASAWFIWTHGLGFSHSLHVLTFPRNL